MLLPYLFAVTRSSFPSPLKSPAASEVGLPSTPYIFCPWSVPSPLPKRRHYVRRLCTASDTCRICGRRLFLAAGDFCVKSLIDRSSELTDTNLAPATGTA